MEEKDADDDDSKRGTKRKLNPPGSSNLIRKENYQKYSKN
jgi:hypothetical protein